MLSTDVLLIAALTVFVAAWWWRRCPARSAVLLSSALIALVAGVIGVADDRWQAGVGGAVSLIMLLALLVTRLRRAGATRVPFVSGTLFVLLGAIAIAALVMFPVSSLTPPTGQHPVGVRTFELSDASRLGVFLAGANEPRRLLVRVWYPAADVAGSQQRQYFSEQEAQTTARDIGASFGFPSLFTYLKHIRTNSYENAPVLAGASRLRVIFYSHGYTSFLGQHTTLMEELASHGYVVFSVQHTFDSDSAVFPNGDVAPVDPQMMADMKRAAAGGTPPSQVQALSAKDLDDRLEGQLQHRIGAIERGDRAVMQSAAIWLADRIFVHDQLQQGKVPDSIADVLAASDLDNVGEMGMSFGGSVTGAVCMTDRRCAAGVNLDGWDLHFDAFDREVPAPFLMFHSDLANLYGFVGASTDGELRSYNEFSYESIGAAGARDDVYRLQLKGAQHLGISDLSLVMRRPLRDPLFGTTPSQVMIGAQRELVRGFFDRHLRGMANNFPQPQMTSYAGWVTQIANSSVREWWAAKTDAQRAALQARIEEVRGARPRSN